MPLLPYTTVAAIRAATGMNDATTIPDSYIAGKIVSATSVINGKIGDAYTLPLASVPGIIAQAASEITIALLYMDQYGEETKDSDKGWKKKLDLWLNDNETASSPLGLLIQIQKLKTKLYEDTTGAELARSTLRNPAFYPNAASSDPETPNSTAPTLTMGRKF